MPLILCCFHRRKALMKETHELTDELYLTQKYALSFPVYGNILCGCCPHGCIKEEDRK